MRKAIPIILFLVIALFGLSTCEGGFIDPNAMEEGMGGGGGGGGGSGSFILTGIPAQHNGRFAEADGLTLGGDFIAGCLRGMENRAPISNGSVTIPLWVVLESGSVRGYSGTDIGFLDVGIYNSQSLDSGTEMASIFFTVNFVRGRAEMSWQEGYEF